MKPELLRWAALSRVCFVGALTAVLAVWAMVPAGAQPEAPWNGPRQIEPGWHALVGATLIPEPGQVVENATIEIRNGSITRVGPDAEPSPGARVWDCSGLTVYSGLIEPALKVDAPKPDADASGTHWNKKVMAQRSPLDGEGVSDDTAKKLRGMGFTAANILPRDGVFRGTTAVVSLGEERHQSDPLANVIKSPVFHAASLESSGWGGGFPGSKMGSIALLRQVLSDTEWRQRALEGHRTHPMNVERPAPDDACDALAAPLPIMFDVDNELDVLRAIKVADEFDRPAVILGSGDEFKRLGAIVDLNVPLIVPLAFADRPDVATMAEREAVELRNLMDWEASPTNLARLQSAGATVAMTSGKLPKKQKFNDNLRLAIEAGLSEDDALAMLTTVPAAMLGLGDRCGKVAPGMQANLVVIDGKMFEKDAKIRDVWIDGQRHEISAAPDIDLEGKWQATFATDNGQLAFNMKVAKGNAITLERGQIEADGAPEDGEDAGDEAEGDGADEADEPKTKSFKARGVKLNENRLDFVVDRTAFGEGEGTVTLSGLVGDSIAGVGSMPGGATFTWAASRAAEDEGTEDKEGKDEEKPDTRFAGIAESFGYPFGPYSMAQLPEEPSILIVRNATVWTSGPDGIIENGEIEASDGKLTYVGSARSTTPSGAVVIDAQGKHVSPGLIDCHSHTGISGGVNEGTQATTSEVRIGDVINPDHMGWYRQLAGGLTAVNQLHGSANPIGGQNSVVKIRWGVAYPDEMRVEGAPSGIKFALGENPKRVRSTGDGDRYPNSRMGVESIIRDRFVAARDYAEDWEAWNSMSASARNGDVPPRRDLELEAVAEILAGERLIHCHSYRQDEILMLCRMAGEFGFTIGTFQHVLEGYKVAEAIKDHAIGGSSFSDWWAFKFEVYDAIPYSGAIMHDVGVVVSFNSDSNELARRMNTEAAKAVKYGGVDPAEALKFVTLNPAMQLGVEDKIGSLETGKHADFVIWSGSPLSSLSMCEATYIDGREYFSLERDAELRETIASERDRIIQKLLATDAPKASPAGPGAGQRWGGRRRPSDAQLEVATLVRDRSGRGSMFVPVGDEVDLEELRYEAMLRQLEEQYDWMVRNGIDAEQIHQGDCGCGINCLFNLRD